MEPKTAGLYIHVPFCKTKCPYCDFYSITDLSLIPSWLDALCKEIDLYQDIFSEFGSLFIGGGTPSLLDGNTLDHLIKTIRAHWSFDSNIESTIELNPDDVTGEKLRLYRTLGINRLSLGIQSFNDSELIFLKRRHTSEGARKALRLIRKAGFKNFSLDLIYGLPGQTEAGWLTTLKYALSYEPTHLSCYQLTVEKNTPFGLLKAEGTLTPLNEKTEEMLFLTTSQFLEAQGFIHYEISNFARSDNYICRHNMKYWRHIPYLGLGPGAHSFSNGQRWWNYRSLEQYCVSFTEGANPVEDLEILTPEQVRLEMIYLGLRTKEGVSLSRVEDTILASTAFADMKKGGLIKVDKGRIVPTRKGFLMADRLPLILSD
ncbi:MAG: coproporphyrinogen III oxidase [Syntrophus sp. (in: bacteria)]|nr:coproporphyrinogen III oxidase [Syntrophus sp. (in: bacteria)]